MDNCDFIKRYGSCTESCVRFRVSCPQPYRKWTVRDYIREALISLAIIAILTALALGF